MTFVMFLYLNLELKLKTLEYDQDFNFPITGTNGYAGEKRF